MRGFIIFTFIPELLFCAIHKLIWYLKKVSVWLKQISLAQSAPSIILFSRYRHSCLIITNLLNSMNFFCKRSKIEPFSNLHLYSFLLIKFLFVSFLLQVSMFLILCIESIRCFIHWFGKDSKRFWYWLILNKRIKGKNLSRKKTPWASIDYLIFFFAFNTKRFEIVHINLDNWICFRSFRKWSGPICFKLFENLVNPKMRTEL